MQYLYRHLFFLCLLLLLVTGCVTLTPEAVNLAIADSQKAFDDAFTIVLAGDKPEYMAELREIERSLSDLKINWDSMPQKEAAETAVALKKQCQHIIEKMREALIREVERLKDEAQKGKNETLISYIPLFNEILKRHKRESAVASDGLKTDLRRIGEITTGKEKILETQTTFRLGRYTLSGTGKRELEKFYRDKILNYFKSLPEDYKSSDIVLTVRIEVTGYTDETGFKKESERRLRRHCRWAYDKNPVINRKKLNKCLSELRSKTICDYLQSRIDREKAHMDKIRIAVETEAEGMGEELPPEFAHRPSWSKRGDRRRICKITVTFNRSISPENDLKKG